MTFLRSKSAAEKTFGLHKLVKSLEMFKQILPSTDRYVIVVDTPSGLYASNTISPVSSGNVSAIVSIDVPSSSSSIWNSCDGIISTPCLYHFPFGFGLPFTFTSNLFIYTNYLTRLSHDYHTYQICILNVFFLYYNVIYTYI